MIYFQVLYLEQLLTTGGGWQDQVGGLGGAVRLGLSERKLPLFVDAVDLGLSEEIVQNFNDRIVLVYTGKTRLARNLLQAILKLFTCLLCIDNHILCPTAEIKERKIGKQIRISLSCFFSNPSL